MKKVFRNSLLALGISSVMSVNALAEVNDYNESYTLKDIEERYVENPFAVFMRADEIMKSENPDYSKALGLFELASKLGIKEASHNAGYIYYNGFGNVDQNYNKAANYHYIAAQDGIVESQMVLATLFTVDDGPKVNLSQAYKFYMMAAQNGVEEAKYYIANMSYYGKGTAMDTELGLRLLNEVAEKTQSRKIYFEIGEIHRKGINASRNYVLALENHEKAAKLGYTESKELSGNMYMYGQGAKINYEKALFWYTSAAVEGSVSSMTKAGDMHLFGQGTSKDTLEAEKWFVKAADSSDADSLYRLASIYMKNENGVDPDYVKAIAYYHKAVNAGHKESMRELAVIYRKGMSDVVEADNFKYNDLMKMYYKSVPKSKGKRFNLFDFEDNQSKKLEMKDDFDKKSFEQYLNK
jgi:TPR repeat protein